MTVDSVGDVDGNDAEDANDVANNDNADELNKEEVNVGSEHVKKVDAHYCELCRVYLPHQEDFETSLRRHCLNRSHLRAYLQFREDKNLRKTAEMVHRRHQRKESKDPKGKIGWILID